MDQSSYQGHSSHHPRQQLFSQHGQLPPPSSLHLPMPSMTRSNTLPPIPSMPLESRYPPASLHPSLSNAIPPLPSPSASHHSPWPTHRTSSSREEVMPSRRREQRGRPVDQDPPPERSVPPQQSQDSQKDTTEDGMPSTSDFVKKLYKMLEDASFSHIVSWTASGDAFVVKDMNDFTKSILPRMFKHSNFASFVRQLNKYDFHKVKNSDENQFGEHSWTFRHPDFQADRRDALENIKRKVPAQRKPTASAAATSAVASRSGANGSPGASPSESADNGIVQALQTQVERLTQSQEEMATHIRHLENNYQSVLAELVNFQRNMAQQDGLMQNLIQYFLQIENSKVKGELRSDDTSDHNPFVPTTDAQRMMGPSFQESDVARASLEQLNEISRRANAAGMSFTNGNMTNGQSATQSLASVVGMVQDSSQNSGQGMPQNNNMSREESLQRISEELSRNRVQQQQLQQLQDAHAQQIAQAQAQVQQQQQQQQRFTNGDETYVMPSNNTTTSLDGYQDSNNPPHSGLQIFTLGHLMPKSDDDNSMWSFDPSALNGTASISDQELRQPQPQASTSTYSTLADAGTSNNNNVVASSSRRTSDSAFDAGPSNAASSSSAGPVSRPGSTLRVRRSTFVPGWAVPPRVLLVDDDAVSRKLSGKFLQVFGCKFDVAVDGVVAVNKMNLEKYDLVLMDIVMPKLDGVTATSMIRQFDHMTPIISMTSNSKPSEILTYYNHGMNDILPKPFTKEGLLNMLEKHLTHLKVIQQMAKVPRSIGIPPLSDSSFDQALMINSESIIQMNSNSNANRDDDEGKINPLAGMGLSDETYAAILQGIVNGETFSGMNSMFMEKRMLDDVSDGRDGKRSRFEVIE